MTIVDKNEMNNKALGYQDDTPPAPKLISALFSAFELEGVQDCVLRNYENLPEDHGNDIDILIAFQDHQKACQVTQDVASSLFWRKSWPEKAF